MYPYCAVPDFPSLWLRVDGATLFVFLGGTDECRAPVSRSFRFTAQ